MKFSQVVNVYPSLPEPLRFLEKLSRNLWWCWQREATDLFRRIDPVLWRETNGNPVKLLCRVPNTRFLELCNDTSFLTHQRRIEALFAEQVENDVSETLEPFGKGGIIAYFSMEFGIHESLPLFAGGLGILAGDHLKSASDLHLPLVGVGLFYHYGYFHQYLDHEGYQQEEYPETEVFSLPMTRVLDVTGNELIVTVDGPNGKIHAGIWLLQIGRIPLYLLDTDISLNPPEFRKITANLYPGEMHTRLTQEILLGIGGMRALDALGLFPTVCHINEGHSAFACVERIRNFVRHFNIDVRTAIELAIRSSVFTTHTPVAAGHDEFPSSAVEGYLRPLEEELGLAVAEMLSWGQPPNHGGEKPFSMFILGKRMAQFCNGVSLLHGGVARRMWAHLWPDLPENEVPIRHVTNGVHVPTWISPEFSLLFERYIGPDWEMNFRDQQASRRFDEFFEEELWRLHEINRARLIRMCRYKMIEQYRRRHSSISFLQNAESVLDQGALTIAFSRRFASYKRAYLILQDIERLEALITNKDRPVQFIFAGKAHPKDREGKDLIKRLVGFARQPHLRHRIVFLEDYDIQVARYLVQGADVWLNTPRRPFEACGTSGMKAALNGVLNVSILDGWWVEGYNPDLGWMIGDGFEYPDTGFQDKVDSQSLYNILENEVIPCFYDRGENGLPNRWIGMMKRSMKMVLNQFSSNRMVSEYEQNFYIPAAYQTIKLLTNNAEEAKFLLERKTRLLQLWKDVLVQAPVTEPIRQYRLGDHLRVSVEVHLGELLPGEVDVELYIDATSPAKSEGFPLVVTMYDWEQIGDGWYRYRCMQAFEAPGRFSYTVRVMPKGDELLRYLPGLISWAVCC
ncbi:alpha-glucan family phosphorylase [Desulfatirhabdium butyrativorans]|uniref:alpha-glucan family phosphorylase n=1 Tax=Desulfatirhabdium butyrativorans TaxID=340467 RepID=UPI000403470B|nr:alpha-glucan family phosphorylase [Desulfatirhabdium butyrativorans]